MADRYASVGQMSIHHSQDFAEPGGYNVRGLNQLLKAAEQQRRAQLRRMQHLKISTERAAAEMRQVEIRNDMERMKEETIEQERRSRAEALAISRAEMEAKRQVTLLQGNQVQEQKRREAEEKVKKVDARAEEIKRDKERAAEARKTEATLKEAYRQEVLFRSSILEEERRQTALRKKQNLDAQLEKKAAEAAEEEANRSKERERCEEHRQLVARRAELEEELRKHQARQRQMEKEYTVQRNQEELEENTRARQQALREREQERRAKVAYAQHLDAVATEQHSRKFEQKMARAQQIDAEREQILATMGRLRQEMSLQETLYKEALHTMKVQSKYDSRSLLDLSQSMADVSTYLSTSHPGLWLPDGSSPVRRGSSTGAPPRPGTAPNNRKPAARGRRVSANSKRASGGSRALTPPRHERSIEFEDQSWQHSIPPVVSGGGGKNRRHTRSTSGGSSFAESAGDCKTKHNFVGRSVPTSSTDRYSSLGGGEVVYEAGAGRGALATASTASEAASVKSAKKLSARQQELKAMIEEEQAKEHSRQATLKAVNSPKERERLMKVFNAEREAAKERILSMSYS
mmetsp:Transcript_34958/g.99109  ORF Transcript_34958/g.99109 Transcript_34958/m.99109 type:complete len:576 (-) Transcript_34958:352-2079(-)